MRYLNFLVILLIIAFAGCNRSKTNFSTKNSTDTSLGIKIPPSWVERVRRLDYHKADHQVDSILLKEFSAIIKPDSLSMEKDYANQKKFVNMIFADLDGEPGEELIVLLGYDYYSPFLCVIKQINGNWYLIYKEAINTFYAPPSLSVANNYSKNKVFYLRRVYNHGSGVYLDGYTFYKLIDGKVYSCLNIINRASIVGWGLYVNQEIKTSFEFDGTADELGVTYDYNFFPGSIYPTDCEWCGHTEISLIRGEDHVNYLWDEKNHSYKLDIPAYKNNSNDLTANKIACFGDFGNDSLFVSAFKKQIDTTLKNGTALQRKILGEYLRLMQAEQNKVNKPLEQKSTAGGTTFYGPSN
ncbi:MAG: hypothetical protein ABIN95_07000 [Mucilaginibacter sp.]